jgi:predicted RNase H-like nuclease (RuvC/YqgF family)
MKAQNITLHFLRLFSEFRKLERADYGKDAALELSAAIIRAYKSNTADLLKKTASDSNLIESLNRHISTLENKISYQTDLIKELKERLETPPDAHK